jgi:glutamate dehydrogenase (NAD(P)+)
VSVPCDIWIPAARHGVLTEGNAALRRCRVVLEGANVPATPGAEEWLHKAGVTVVPDFIANADGVLLASVEYYGGTRAQAFALIDEILRVNTAALLARSADEDRTPREGAETLALARFGGYVLPPVTRSPVDVRLQPGATGHC